MILEFYKCIFNAMYAQSLCSMIARHKWQTETVMFYIPKPSISGIGVGVDKKIPRHTEKYLVRLCSGDAGVHKSKDSGLSNSLEGTTHSRIRIPGNCLHLKAQ